MIRRQLAGGLRDALSTPLRSVIFILQIAISTLLLALSIGVLSNGIAVLVIAHRLGPDITYFSLSYDGVRVPTLTQPGEKLLTEKLDDANDAYSIVQNNWDPSGVGARGLVIAASSGFGRVYAIYDGPIGDGVAVMGAAVPSGQGATVDTSGGDYKVVGRLDRGASYLDPTNGVTSLDHATILLLPTKTLLQSPGSEHAFEEVIGRLVLLHNDPAFVARYTTAIHDSGGITVLPHRLTDQISGAFATRVRDAVAYTAVFTLGMVFVVAGIGSTLAVLTRRNLRQFAILRMNGARLFDLGLRVEFYLLLVLVIPAFLVILAASAISPDFARLASAAAGIVVLADAALVIHAITIVRRTPIIELMSRRE